MRNGTKILIIVALAAMAIVAMNQQRTPAPVASPPRQTTPILPQPAYQPSMAETRQGMAALSLMLKDLIVTHPDDSIRRDLFNLIDTVKVSLNFQDDLTFGSGALATVMWVDQPQGPTLVLSIASMQLMDTTQAREYKQLVIYHEYQHILQQMQGRCPRELATLQVATSPPTERMTRLLIDAEVEAYEAEVKLAVRLDWQRHIPEFCRAYEQGQRRGLYRLLTRRYAEENPIYANQRALLQRIADEH